MVIYVTGTGNSLAVAWGLADKTGDCVVPLRAVRDANLAGPPSGFSSLWP